MIYLEILGWALIILELMNANRAENLALRIYNLMIAGIEWVVTEVDRADNPNQALLGLGALIVLPLAIFPSLMIGVADLFGQGAAASDFLTGMQGMRDTGVIGLRILSVVAGTGVVILILLLYFFLRIVAAHPHGVLSGLGVALALATSILSRIGS